MKGFKKIIVLFTAVALLITVIPKTTISAHEHEDIEKHYCHATIDDHFTDNEIIVMLMPCANYTTYNADSFSEINCISVNEINRPIKPNCVSRIIKLTLSANSKQNVLDAINILYQRDDIFSAEPNYLFQVDVYSQDEYLSDQWGLQKISIEPAWQIFMPYSRFPVKVGVLDTGIDASHPDLADVVNTSASRNFLDAHDIEVELPYSNPEIQDPVGHGTHVAGIIGADISTILEPSSTEDGIAGVSPHVELISLRVLDEYGSASIEAIMEAIEYATEEEIPILNCSFCIFPSDSTIASLSAVIEDYPGIVVCSAGNKDRDTDQHNNYPSTFAQSHSNVISVGASTENDDISDYSNYGITTVDLFAPGDEILSTYPRNLCDDDESLTDDPIHYAYGYHNMSGTSMAAPHVTGVVALMKAINPSLSNSLIKAILLNTVDKTAEFDGCCKSGGRLNAYKAVLATTKYNDSSTTYSSLDSKSHNTTYSLCNINGDECPECASDGVNHNNCSGCECCSIGCWVTVSEAHNFVIQNNGANGHIVVCQDCGYTGTTSHNLYFFTRSNTSNTVKCHDCEYSVSFSNTPSYTIQNSRIHNVTYSQGSSFSEGHKWEYVYDYDDDDNNNKTYHLKRCKYCGYEKIELHDWYRSNIIMRTCNDCNKLSYIFD